MTLEIHGKVGCPFAWRVRIAARLKGAAYEWLALDADAPDARSATHNPDKKSPLLWDDGFALIESTVIAQFIDESREGRALQPQDAKKRAQQRVALVEVNGLMVPPRQVPAPPDIEKKIADGHAALEKKLADGRAFFDGEEPGMIDVHAWPALALHASRNIAIAEGHAKLRAYWERSKAHDVYAFTKPPWA
jgi:glutathione S-transferase